jgi:four helix bundle protein
MATVNRLKDLDTWRLARDLKIGVYAILGKPNVRRDREFCDQIRESARSAPRNIAEGFGRRRPREFARFLMIALGSLRETQNHLQDALDLHYVDRSEFNALIKLSSRAIGAAVHLSAYLDTCPDRSPDLENRRTPNPKRSKPETPKPETSNPETPQPETPKPENPKPENPKPENPRPRNPAARKGSTSEQAEEP